MTDDQERLNLLMLVHGLDTRLARIERLLGELGDAVLHRKAAKMRRRPTARRVARELAYANPCAGQVWRVRAGGPCYLATLIDAAALRLRLVPARWDMKQRAVTSTTVNAERWVDVVDLRGGYEYVGFDLKAVVALATQEVA